MSSRLQNGFVRFMNSFQPFHALLKRYSLSFPSLADNTGSFTSQSMNFSCRMNNNEKIGMMESNLQDDVAMINSCSPEVSSHNEVCSTHRDVKVDSAVVLDRHNCNNTQVVRKKPLMRKRSLSAGNVRHSHKLDVPQEDISKRFSDLVLSKD